MSEYVHLINGVEVDSSEYWRRFHETVVYEEHNDWQLLEKTSPSGKRLFECRKCKLVSCTPDKKCPVERVDTGDTNFHIHLRGLYD